MSTILLIFSFIAGTIIGSFLNVVAIRFNTGKGINGRSRCMSCGNQLTWKELIPIASYIIQGGICRKCSGKISWQYPLVEFITGLLFLLVFIYFPPITAVSYWTTFILLFSTGLLVVMAVYDIKHKIIPDRFVYFFAALSFVNLFVGGVSWFHGTTLVAILAGPILALPFVLIWYFSKGTWMGLGDSKLILGIGWLLGFSAGLNALILSFWIAAIISITWLYATKGKFQPRTEIPFGPFLITGFFLVLFFQIQVIDMSFLKEIILSFF